MDTIDEPRIILRYANRKMYDTKASRHTTTETIVELVQEGAPFRVLSCADKVDLTQTVLCSVLNRIARAPGAKLDESLLLRAIKSHRVVPEVP